MKISFFFLEKSKNDQILFEIPMFEFNFIGLFYWEMREDNIKFETLSQHFIKKIKIKDFPATFNIFLVNSKWRHHNLEIKVFSRQKFQSFIIKLDQFIFLKQIEKFCPI